MLFKFKWLVSHRIIKKKKHRKYVNSTSYCETMVWTSEVVLFWQLKEGCFLTVKRHLGTDFLVQPAVIEQGVTVLNWKKVDSD